MVHQYVLHTCFHGGVACGPGCLGLARLVNPRSLEHEAACGAHTGSVTWLLHLSISILTIQALTADFTWYYVDMRWSGRLLRLTLMWCVQMDSH